MYLFTALITQQQEIEGGFISSSLTHASGCRFYEFNILVKKLQMVKYSSAQSGNT